MPSRNIIKIDIENTYYHIYNRGVNKQSVFLDDEDFVFFIGLLKRYLSPEQAKDRKGSTYPNFNGSISLLSYCIMTNHFHLFIYQKQQGAMPQLMRAILTSYSNYFNRKYVRRGPVFESRYKANNIDNDGYLQHISRYIHLNPTNWKDYQYSSLQYYLGNKQSAWLNPSQITSIFNTGQEYLAFLEDYTTQKDIMDELKWLLAHE